MYKNGFTRFCDDPEPACCRAENELARLRGENKYLREALKGAQMENEQFKAEQDARVREMFDFFSKRSPGQKEVTHVPEP